MAKKADTYTANDEGFINGLFVAKGGTVDLTEAQAEFYAGQVVKVSDTPAEAPKVERKA